MTPNLRSGTPTKMEELETNAIPLAADPSASTTAPESRMQVLRGVHSGEICARVHHEALCAADGAVHGLAAGLHSLALTPPTLQQLMAPWKHTRESLRSKRLCVRERRRLVRDRHGAARSVLAAYPTSTESLEPLVDATAKVSASAASSMRFTAAYHSLESLFAQHAMRVVMENFALLEQERAWVAAWQQRETQSCQELLRITKRRHHLTSFAVHLESETAAQIRMWRLTDGDAQRTRCVKAATENIKKGFFHGGDGRRVEVTDVYKIENKLQLRAFERWVDANTTASTSAVKVKGLFCCVPTEGLEHCVVWGVHSNERELARHAGISDQQVFNRPCAPQSDRDGVKTEAPGTGRRFVALQRVTEASAMQFPRRFSRYSTLNEQQEAVLKDLEMQEPPVRYLALCRVAMGKIQRMAPSTGPTEFPPDASVGSQYFPEDEEYVVRHPQAIVPEFLVEYRFTRTASLDRIDVSVEDRVLTLNLQGHPVDQRSLFQSAAQEIVSSTANGGKQASPCSLFPSHGPIPPVFGKSETNHHRNGTRDESKLHMTTETALEKSGRRRQLQVQGLGQMRAVLWTQAQAMWSSLNASIVDESGVKAQASMPSKDHSSNQQANGREESSPPVKKQSFKAKKLYGELALVRQLQERDAVKNHELLGGSKKPRPSNNSESRQPRPFR